MTAGDRLAKRHADDDVLLLTDRTWPGLRDYLAEYPEGSAQRGGREKAVPTAPRAGGANGRLPP